MSIDPGSPRLNGNGFAGQIIAISGGASGIGLEVARWLLDRGAIVSLIDLEPQWQNVPQSLWCDHLSFQTADVSDPESVRRAFLEIESRHGQLHGLVSSAGTRMASTPLIDLEWSEWERVLGVNLKGVVLCCKEAARIMVNQRYGSIVNVASIAARSARPGQSAYAASKAAVVQFTRVLALELAESGVRVNAVCPGTTATPMIEQAKLQDGADLLNGRINGDPRIFRPGIPLRRIADSEDQAGAVVFLLSGHARHITGQAIYVDGGESVV